MTLKEAAHIVAILQINYPDTYRTMSDESLHEAVRLWQKMFDAEPVSLVLEAVEAFMRTSTDRFAPNVGQIKEQIRKLTQPRGMSETEAWSRISAALRNSTYGYREEYAKLPPTLQKVVGSPEQLREWAQMDAETVQSVVASNVMRSYRVEERREAEMAKLPEAVRERMAALTDLVCTPLGSAKAETVLPPPQPEHTGGVLHPSVRAFLQRKEAERTRPLTPEEWERKRQKNLEALKKEP